MNEDVSGVPKQSLTPPKNAAMMPASRFCGMAAQENRISRQVLKFQVVVALLCAGIAYGMEAAPQFAIAVLCGGGISVANGALLAWRMARSAMQSTQEAHYQLRLLYFYAAERFLVVVVLLAICMIALKFPPPALLGGFVVVQAALIAARLYLNKFKDD